MALQLIGKRKIPAYQGFIVYPGVTVTAGNKYQVQILTESSDQYGVLSNFDLSYSYPDTNGDRLVYTPYIRFDYLDFRQTAIIEIPPINAASANLIFGVRRIPFYNMPSELVDVDVTLGIDTALTF